MSTRWRTVDALPGFLSAGASINLCCNSSPGGGALTTGFVFCSSPPVCPNKGLGNQRFLLSPITFCFSFCLSLSRVVDERFCVFCFQFTIEWYWALKFIGRERSASVSLDSVYQTVNELRYLTLWTGDFVAWLVDRFCSIFPRRFYTGISLRVTSDELTRLVWHSMENGVCLMSRNQRGELSNFSVFGPAQLQAELFFRSSSRDILASSHSRQAIRLSGCLISIGMRFSDSWRCSRCPLPPFGYCAIAIPPSSTLSLLTLDRPSQRFTDISKFLFL